MITEFIVFCRGRFRKLLEQVFCKGKPFAGFHLSDKAKTKEGAVEVASLEQRARFRASDNFQFRACPFRNVVLWETA